MCSSAIPEERGRERERERVVSALGIWILKIPIDAFDTLSVSVNCINGAQQMRNHALMWAIVCETVEQKIYTLKIR